jgi:16S rRNA G1207 methylase RsmC
LEVGIGIGCIADAILESGPNLQYTATEANEFCINAIKKNVDQIERVKLYNYLNQIPENTYFDFIIIDGSDDSLAEIKRMCKAKTVIFIEGGRALQVASLKKIFPKVLHAEMLSDYKNPACGPFSSQSWCGGGQLIFPYPNFKMRLYYWREKWATYLKRKKRKAHL